MRKLKLLGIPDYRMICWECAKKTDLEQEWDSSSFRCLSGSPPCMFCGKDESLHEVDFAKAEEKRVLQRSW